MSMVLTSLPVGERVGIAFSGGLETSGAVERVREALPR
jgi:argininosuccinate synthase